MSADDIEAINTYIVNTPVKNPEAGNLQAQWRVWYNNLNFIEKALDSTFQDASNRRTVFNAANLNPEDLTHAADLTPERAVAKQAAIAHSTVLTPAQKSAAMAKNPNIPTTNGVPGSAATHATIKQGSSGSDVIAWQQLIGVTADGKFGPATTTATKTWQKSHGLTADGIVGPKSWSAAIGAPVQEAPSGGVSSGPTPFIAAPPTSPPFQTVSPSVSAHIAAVKAGTTPPPTSAVNKAAATLKIATGSTAAHTALKIGIPAAGLIAGGWLFGLVGAVAGGALGLFGSTKV